METQSTTPRPRIARITLRSIVLAIAAVFGLTALPAVGVIVAPGEAHAVVGRPFTPVSYAGVARRSSRRVARRTAYRTTAAMTTLPAGCVSAGVTYTCGSSTYEQVVDGGNVVYIDAD